VEKGQEMSRAEAIQNGVVNFQRYNCLSVPACSVGTWEKSRRKELSNLLPKSSIQWTIINFFIPTLLRLGSRGVHQSEIWVALKNVWEISG